MPETKEWTLMFYFASDNPLAPTVVSQLKAIKNAGYHPEANVIAQFDPQAVGTPTHIFDVNLMEKLKNPGQSDIGFTANDPYVRKLIEDKLWSDQKNRDGKSLIRDLIKQFLADEDVAHAPYDPPTPPNNGNNEKVRPRESLWNFLKFCSDNYPARHYMLFLLGHGLVVGNDIFMFDEHADGHSMSLLELGQVLNDFKRETDKQKAQFELVSFHSCSVSSLEVAYELQGTANYMLASQGPAFVGSWPYRQILLRVFNDLDKWVKRRKEINIKEMLVKIFYYCLHNSADFMLAGYSFDLCLCNLNYAADVKKPIEELSDTLIFGLTKPLIRDFILLSHWKSQSYWRESYTDLYDFCFCLSKHCKDYEETAGEMTETMGAVHKACDEVMGVLMKEAQETDDKFTIRAEFAGPAYQYSHGLSVFFPWAEPSSDSPIMEEYQHLKFKETSWCTFLNRYFVATMRDTHQSQSEFDRLRAPMLVPSAKDHLLEDIASLVYNREGQLSNENSLNGDGNRPEKTHPNDPLGGDCTCPSIKNHPHDTRPRRVRGKQADEKSVPISEDWFKSSP